MSEIFRLVSEIDDKIMKYRTENADIPKHLILPMEHRQALRVYFAKSINKEVYDLPPNTVVTYASIPIIKKEESIIV